jgi:hypothetical protein
MVGLSRVLDEAKECRIWTWVWETAADESSGLSVLRKLNLIAVLFFFSSPLSLSLSPPLFQNGVFIDAGIQQKRDSI